MKKGITLVELLITISIIGIMTGIAIPVTSHLMPGIKLSGSARLLSFNLREAQERTITEQKRHLIRFSQNETPINYKMIRINDSTEELIKQVNLSNQETVALEETITDHEIVFSPDGGPSSSGEITLAIDSINKIVSVSPAGFIKIEN